MLDLTLLRAAARDHTEEILAEPPIREEMSEKRQWEERVANDGGQCVVEINLRRVNIHVSLVDVDESVRNEKDQKKEVES